MPSPDQSQDILVGIVALVLGIGAWAGAISRGKWVSRSNLTQSLHAWGGPTAVIITYALLGTFLIGVGISLIR